MVRSLVGILALGCVCVASSAGDVVKQPEQQSPTAERIATSPSGLGRIDGMVTKIREAETEHAPAAAIAQLYESLSSAFAKLGAYPQAQGALRQASALLRKGSEREQAQVLGQLTVLDVAVGDVRHAVKDQAQALRIWEKLDDRRELALAWNDVAELDIRLGKFSDALAYARKAMESVGRDAPVSARDRIAVRQTLGFALCGSGRASDAVPLMKEAMQVAQATSGADSLDMGMAEYSLGFAYWRSGDVPNAGMWMRQGLALLKANREWGRGPYLHAMTQYATFLQQQGRTDEALSMEREIRIENSIIDVSALQPPR